MVVTVNINKATSHKIHTELGISKTKSHAIIEAHKKAGGQLTVDDLKKVFKANPDFAEFLLETGAIDFGSPWAARKSAFVCNHTEVSAQSPEPSLCKDDSSECKVVFLDETNASSMYLASDVNGVSPDILEVSQQATGLSQPATSVSIIDEVTPEADEWEWVYIGNDDLYLWVTEKDKSQAIIQYLSEQPPTKSGILLVRDKECVMGVANFLMEAGYPLVYCHEGRTLSQNAEMWDSFSKKRYPILVASLKSDALYSLYDPHQIFPWGHLL